MIELITDRTEAHVLKLKELQAKGWAKLTTEEQDMWYGYAAKGGYNYTDLNRVESAVAEMSEDLELGLVTKTDWTLWDFPARADMARYLENVRKIRNAVWGGNGLPELPIRMDYLTYKEANTIETVLLETHKRVESVPRAGEILCGEV